MRLRIDDFPSGIRPIPKESSRYYPILTRIDSFEMPYLLGIVPAICTDADWEFLKSLKFMIPAMHGITHKYFEYSAFLESKGDPNNERTFTNQFNELSGIHSRYLPGVLSSFRQKMQSKLNLSVTIFIPPCNRITVAQSKALRDAGFESIYSESRNPLLKLPNFKSDFYGRSDEFVINCALTTLHITWEYDVYCKWGYSSIDYLMSEISSKKNNFSLLHESRRDWFDSSLKK